jgi:hypothetical protein
MAATRTLIMRSIGPNRIAKTSAHDLQIAKSVELAIWLAFAGNLGRGIFHNSDLLRHIIFRPMVDAAGGVLILQGIVTFLEEKRGSDNERIHLLTCLVLILAVFAMVNGLTANPNLMYWFQMGLMGFGTGVAVFLAGRPLVFESVFRALRRQILFADIFVAYILLHWTEGSRFDWFWTDQGNEALGAIANRCFFALPFLVAYYSRLKPWESFLVGAGFVEYLVLNLRGENRSAVIIGLFVIPILLIGITLRQRGSLQKVWRAALCAGVVGVLFLYNVPWSDGFEPVMQRFGVADVSTAQPSEIVTGMNTTAWDNFAGNGPRAEELRELIADTSPAQFIFGRGFGVSWYCPLWAASSSEWYVVHVGPGYMMLVGGLPLAICFTALLALAIWKAWKNVNRVPGAAGALVFLSAAAVNYMQHGFFLDEPEFYFLWLCIGFSVGGPRLYSPSRVARRPINMSA